MRLLSADISSGAESAAFPQITGIAASLLLLNRMICDSQHCRNRLSRGHKIILGEVNADTANLKRIEEALLGMQGKIPVAR